VRDHPNIAPLWQFLTFTENVPPWPTPGLAFSHVWSLCVEEQFYLIFPAVVALIALKPTPSRVTLSIVLVLIMGMLLRGYLWLRFVAETPFDIAADPHGPFMQLIYYPTDTRLDGLLMGVAAAAIQAFRPRTWARLTARPNLLLVAGLAGVVASSFVFNNGQNARFWATVFGYPFLSFSIVLIVMAAASPRSLIGRYRVPGCGRPRRRGLQHLFEPQNRLPLATTGKATPAGMAPAVRARPGCAWRVRPRRSALLGGRAAFLAPQRSAGWAFAQLTRCRSEG